jgi:hypothetical protein
MTDAASGVRPGMPALDLWSVPAFLDYVQPALTSEAVRGAQLQLGIRLPASYLMMLEVQNGGYLRATWPDSPHTCLNGIGPGFPSITRDEAWWRAPGAEDEMWVPPQRELLIPFDGDGHWDLCFDYRVTGPDGEPSIAFIDNEVEQDVQVADSFESFLAGLVDEVEQTAIRIYADIGLDEFAEAFAVASGAEVADQGSWNNGYRHLRANLGGDGMWAWIGPNRVPSGFRRDGNDVVVTSATGLRLPRDEACRLIVEFTAAAAEATHDAVRATGHGKS